MSRQEIKPYSPCIVSMFSIQWSFYGFHTLHSLCTLAYRKKGKVYLIGMVLKQKYRYTGMSQRLSLDC